MRRRRRLVGLTSTLKYGRQRGGLRRRRRRRRRSRITNGTVAAPETCSSRVGNAGWLPHEDLLLREMIEREGTGDWEGKSRKLGTDRSADAMRRRWYKLSKDAAERSGGAVGVDDRLAADDLDPRWTAAEDAQLQRMVTEEGAGNWQQLARLHTERSADALRFRWDVLQKEGGERSSGSSSGALSTTSFSGGTRAAGSDDGGPAASWTAAEDAELRRLCQQGGSWAQKAAAFSTNRTANALRHRWANFLNGTIPAYSDQKGNPESAASGSWTAEEDEELRRAVEVEGPADWKGKAARFSTGRSEGALRRRWPLIQRGGVSASSEAGPAAPSPSGVPPASWLQTEDAQLRAMVRAEGSGNWQDKADRFLTQRSAGALRFRWYVLKEEDTVGGGPENSPGGGSGAGLGAVSGHAGWTQREDQLLSRLVTQEGTGNWQQKAARFGGKRTANGLRHRWTHYLRDETGQQSSEDHSAATVPDNLTAARTNSPRTDTSGLRPPQNRLSDWLGLRVELNNGRQGIVEGGGHGYFEVRMLDRPSAVAQGEPLVVKKRAQELRLVRKGQRGGDGSRSTGSHRSSGSASGFADATAMIGARVSIDSGEKGVVESSGHGFFTVRLDGGHTIKKRGHELTDESGASAGGNTSKRHTAAESLRNSGTIGWSCEADHELHRMVARFGAGNWQRKAVTFGSRQCTARALRKRWVFLKDKVPPPPETTDYRGKSAGAALGRDEVLIIPPTATFVDQSWRSALTTGDSCQCLYAGGWWNVEVMQVKAPGEDGTGSISRATRHNSADEVRVHYRGWKATFDEWVPRLSNRLWPTGLVPEWFPFKHVVDGSCLIGSAAARVLQARAELRPWSATEDAKLKQLVKRDGLGDSGSPAEWVEKARLLPQRDEQRRQAEEERKALEQAAKLAAEQEAAQGQVAAQAATAAGSGDSVGAAQGKNHAGLSIRVDGTASSAAQDGPSPKALVELKSDRGFLGPSSIVDGRRRRKNVERFSEISIPGSHDAAVARRKEQREATQSGQAKHHEREPDGGGDRSAAEVRERWAELLNVQLDESSSESSEEELPEQPEPLALPRLQLKSRARTAVSGPDSKPRGGMSPYKTSVSTDDASSEVKEQYSRVEWTDEEDQLLIKLVSESGTGDWKDKLKHFSTRRSEGALRRRWYFLRDEQADAKHVGGDDSSGSDTESIPALAEGDHTSGSDAFPSRRSGRARKGRAALDSKDSWRLSLEVGSTCSLLYVFKNTCCAFTALCSGDDNLDIRDFCRSLLCCASISRYQNQAMFDAKVIEVREPDEENQHGSVKIHYQGWSHNYDEWIPRLSSRLHRYSDNLSAYIC
jgi:hypothetical protein